jgi:hypothetical protein
MVATLGELVGETISQNVVVGGVGTYAIND